MSGLVHRYCDAVNQHESHEQTLYYLVLVLQLRSSIQRIPGHLIQLAKELYPALCTVLDVPVSDRQALEKKLAEVRALPSLRAADLSGVDESCCQICNVQVPIIGYQVQIP